MSETGVAALSEADLDADSTLGESGFSQRARRAHRLEPAAVTSNKPGSDDRGSSLGASPWLQSLKAAEPPFQTEALTTVRFECFPVMRRAQQQASARKRLAQQGTPAPR